MAVVTPHCTFWFATVSGDHKASVESTGHTGCCDGMQDVAVLFRYSSACPESIHALCNRGAVPLSAALQGSLPQWKCHGGTISNRWAGVALSTLILPLMWLRERCTLHCQAYRVPMEYKWHTVFKDLRFSQQCFRAHTSSGMLALCRWHSVSQSFKGLLLCLYCEGLCSPRRILLGLLDPWRWKHYSPSKHKAALNYWHDVTSQNTLTPLTVWVTGAPPGSGSLVDEINAWFALSVP